MSSQLDRTERRGLPPGRRADTSPHVNTTAALEALDDPDCRALLEASASEPRTAGDLIERSGVPRSTTYRKLDDLVEAGLLEEQVRIRRNGSHASEYRRTVEDVVVSISAAGEVEVDVSPAAHEVD